MLAGTFSVLAVLPLVTLTEIGFTVAFGVLLDTFIVRTMLVPALVLEIGDRVWWPSRLAHSDPTGGAAMPTGQDPGGERLRASRADGGRPPGDRPPRPCKRPGAAC